MPKVSQEHLDCTSRIALEALPLQRGPDAVSQSLDRMGVGAVRRKHQRIISVGEAVGEMDLHER